MVASRTASQLTNRNKSFILKMRMIEKMSWLKVGRELVTVYLKLNRHASVSTTNQVFDSARKHLRIKRDNRSFARGGDDDVWLSTIGKMGCLLHCSTSNQSQTVGATKTLKRRLLAMCKN